MELRGPSAKRYVEDLLNMGFRPYNGRRPDGSNGRAYLEQHEQKPFKWTEPPKVDYPEVEIKELKASFTPYLVRHLLRFERAAVKAEQNGYSHSAAEYRELMRQVRLILNSHLTP